MEGKQIVKVYDLSDHVTVESKIEDMLNQGYRVVQMTQSGCGTMTFVCNILTVLYELKVE